MRISGYAEAEVVAQLYDGEILEIADLQQYQHPHLGRSLNDTLQALTGSPEHSPLYYLLARWWVQFFDPAPENLMDSVWVIRSFSAMISLLAFPCVFWLSLELFGSALTGWVAIALLAVSPFHVLYAQEARPYSLWIVTLLLSGAALLGAMRRQTWLSWGFYALTVALGLYTFLFSALVTVGHGLYVGAMCLGRNEPSSRMRRAQTVSSYLLATLVGWLSFVPWLWVIAQRYVTLQRNVAHLSQTPSNLVQMWLLNLSRIFFDFNHGSSWLNPLLYIALVLSLYALFYVCQHTRKQTWLFILTLIGVTGTALILSDLILGGQRSAIARYPVPCYLGIQLAVAYLISRKIAPAAYGMRPSKGWQRAAVGLFLLGVVSCGISSQVAVWWNKGPFKTQYNPEIAEVLNEQTSPLVISDSSVERVLSLGYLLDPNVKLKLLLRPNGVDIPEEFNPIFLYQPSRALRNQVERQASYDLGSVKRDWLWQVERQTG